MIRGKQVPFLVPRTGESTGYIRVSSGFGANADGVVYKNEVKFRYGAIVADRVRVGGALLNRAKVRV